MFYFIFLISPLYVIFVEVAKTLKSKELRVLDKYLTVFILTIIFILSRSIFLIFNYMLIGFYDVPYMNTEGKVLVVTNIIDLVYWAFLSVFEFMSGEEKLWRLTWFYFAEWFVMVIFTVIIMYLIG